MMLRSVVRDCLQVNWALPAAALPPPPQPLRYEEHPSPSGARVFVSALFFRQESLHFDSLPWVRLSYPQFNLRICVRDPREMPAVLFHTILVPSWVVPASRLVGRQAAEAGRFDYPPSTACAGVDCLGRWRVERDGVLTLVAEPGPPEAGREPRLGDWEETVARLRRRSLGYAPGPSGLTRIDANPEHLPAAPVRVEIEEDTLLAVSSGLCRGRWPPPHSAWISTRTAFSLELSAARERPLAQGVPAPG